MNIGGNANTPFVPVTSDPDGVLTMPRGTVAIDSTTGAMYRNRNGGTRWDVFSVPPNFGNYSFYDFENASLGTATNVATGTQGTASALLGRSGIWFLNVSAAADVAIQRTVSNLGFLFGYSKERFRASIRISSALSDGTDNYTLRAGWGDSSTSADHVDGVYFECSRAGNGNNNWYLCTSNNSTRTKTDTGIAATNATSQELEIQVNAAGTSVTGWINGVAVATPVTTNIPTASGRECGMSVQSVKDLGSATRTVFIDWIEHVTVLTAARDQ